MNEYPSARASRPLVFEPEIWQQAEAKLAPCLARAAGALGALDALCESAPWLCNRLALIEVETMLWTQGILLKREEIGRELMAARGADVAGLLQARWSLRRLLARRDSRDLRDLRRFLGLHRNTGTPDVHVERPQGMEFDYRADDFIRGLDRFRDLHPLSQAAAALALWRSVGLSAVEDVIEAGTYAAIIAAHDLDHLGFVPFGQSGAKVWRGTGDIETRLGRWLDGVRRGAEIARDELRGLMGWHARALDAVQPMKGSTPARIVELALQRPLLATEDAEVMLQISRDTAERGLARLETEGILREVTGRERFRLWAAAI